MVRVYRLILISAFGAEALPAGLRVALGLIATVALISAICVFIGTRRPSD